jgi:O-antigen/teichoic acid export membrane protein
MSIDLPERDPNQLKPRESRRSRLHRLLPSDFRWFGIGSIPLFFAIGLANLSNLLFHVEVSRLIGPSKYGELAALLSVMFVVAVPVSVVQTIAAKKVAIMRAEGQDDFIDDVLRTMAKTLAILGGSATLLLVAAAPIIAGFLHISWIPAALIGPYFGVALLTGLAFGALQGKLRFGALSIAVVASVLLRLVLGLALTAGGFGVTGAMVATVAAALLSAILAMSLARIAPRDWIRTRFTVEAFRRDFRPALLALGAFALLSQIDLVLARHYLEPNAAGLYSGAALIARALLFLPAVIAIVAFPRFAELHGTGAQARRWLHISIIAVIAIATCATILVIALREPIVARVLGTEFGDAVTVVPALSVAMTSMAVVNLLIYFHVAVESFAYRFILLGVAGETILIAIFHDSVDHIAFIVVLVGTAMALLLYYAARAASISPESHGAAGAPSLRDSGAAVIDVSVVLPCHNSGTGIEGVLAELCGDLLGPLTSEVIVVSDGSTDDTVNIARSFAPRVRVIERHEQAGKGTALRVGLSEARGRYVAFMDSDGDIHPRALKPFIGIMDLFQPDIVLGSKRHPLSDLRYPTTRRIMSWSYHKLTRVLFRVNVRDTQTGLKMIRREVLEAVLPSMLEKRYAFDLELLVIARLCGFDRVFEAPVTIDYGFTSGIDAKQTLRIVLDTLAIYYRRYFLGTYHRSISAAEIADPTVAMPIDTVDPPPTPLILTADEAADQRI